MKIGEKINMLTMISEPWSELRHGRPIRFTIVRCECGKEKTIRCDSIPRTQSCGCYKLKDEKRKNHSGHPLYKKYHSLKTRYGKLGISEEWSTFEKFKDWSEQFAYIELVLFKHKEGPAGPETCRYTTYSEFCGKKQNPEKAKKTCIEKYGVENPNQSDTVKNKTKEKNLEKTGYAHHTQNPEWKKKQEEKNIEKWGVKSNLMLKDSQDKMKKTNLERYGTEYACESKVVKDKVKATCLEKYGVEIPLLSKEVQQKARDCVMDKYGVTSIRKIPGVNEKIKETCIEKYGVDNPWKAQSVKEKCIDSKIEKYGEFFYLRSTREMEGSVGNFLNSFGYEFKSNWKILCPKQLDFYCEELKLALEFNGLYWHSEGSISPREETYHYNKYKQCLDLDINLLTIWSDEWILRKSQVENYLSNLLSKPSPAKNYQIKIIDNTTGINFIENNSIVPSLNIDICTGLFIDNKLMGVMSFINSYLDKICTIGNYDIQIIKEMFEFSYERLPYNTIYVISDNRFIDFSTYIKLGFEIKGHIDQDYEYVKISSGCDKRYNKNELSDTEGYAKIWDCGKVLMCNRLEILD